MISLELQSKIRRLFFGEHWKVGTIAAELGIHPDTIKRAIDLERFRGSRTVIRASKLDAYKAFVLETLEKHPRLRATRIYGMIRPLGYQGSVVHLRRFIKTVRPRRREAFLRLETLPGEQGQVDWASFGTIRIGRAERKLSCFVMVLSRCRAIFARFALDQTLESFVRGHLHAFEAFGGVPRKLLYDNLKSVVLEREGDLIRYHPRILELAGHYHFAPQPCAPYRGNEKGKVERAIHYLRYSFFQGRHVVSVDDLNRQLREWLEDVAFARPCPFDTSRSVREAFAEEASCLLPLPQHPFETSLVRPVTSGKTPYVRFDANDYSIPHILTQKTLTLVAEETSLRILDGSLEVAHHARSYDRGERIEEATHLQALGDEKRRARELRTRDRLRAACPHAADLLAGVARRGEPVRSHTSRLIGLLERYGATLLEDAIVQALAKGACSAPSVAHILEQQSRREHSKPALPTITIDSAKRVEVLPHKLSAYDSLSSSLIANHKRQGDEP